MKFVVADVDKLNAAIEASQLSLESIAEKSYIDTKTLYNIRKGRETKISTLGQVARVLDTNVIELSRQDGEESGEIETFEVELDFVHQEIDATQYHAQLMAEQARNATHVVWHLGLSQIQSSQADAIYAVKNIVDEMATWRTEGFDVQVSMALRTTELADKLRDLAELGIHVLGASRFYYAYEQKNDHAQTINDRFRIRFCRKLYLVFCDERIAFGKMQVEQQFTQMDELNVHLKSIIERSKQTEIPF